MLGPRRAVRVDAAIFYRAVTVIECIGDGVVYATALFAALAGIAKTRTQLRPACLAA
jgi:hypothetical protein